MGEHGDSLGQLDSSLAEMQQWMQQALMRPSANTHAFIERLVKPTSRLSGTQALGIYQRAYILRLIHCLEEQFPALKYALGDDVFGDFCKQYLFSFPSASHSLYDLGRHFPKYLEATRPDETNREDWVDFMIDLAWCEWHLFQMFDAPGQEENGFAAVGMRDDELRLQPFAAIYQYSFPVSWFYHEVKNGTNPQVPARATSHVALVRKDYVTCTYPLSLFEFQFLKVLQQGCAVSQAIQELAHITGQDHLFIREAWQERLKERWIRAGFFTTL